MNLVQRLLYRAFPPYRERLNSKIIRDGAPIYTDFGNDVYISDIVKQAVKAIAVETSKITLKSVTESTNPRSINVNNDSITKLFSCKPNPIMTTQEFFARVAWLRKTKLNVFIYPQYITHGGKKEYVAMYPLDPIMVEFLECEGDIYITLHFIDSQQVTLPYDEIIHLRDEFFTHPLLGGNAEGQPENRELLKTVSVLDKAMQGLPKAISTSLEVRGVYNVKSTIGREELKKERAEFDKQISESNGIIALGYEGEFMPTNINPQLIPKEILDWLENKILKNYGVSIPIISGDFTEDQSSAFYQKCIEDFVIQVEQAFTAVLYTERQREKGCKIKIYDRLIQHLSMGTRLKMLEVASPMGAFGKDEVRELLGYEPTGDNTTMQSLNWISSTFAPEYQLNRSGARAQQSPQQSLQTNTLQTAEQVTGEKLNGAQIQSLISVTQAVANGTITRDSALAILTSTLGISEENANRIIIEAKKEVI